MTNFNIKLLEFLEVSRAVTDNYIKAWGKWSLEEQRKKIEEEELEFKNAYSRDNKLEEFWDNFFAKLTELHLDNFNDNEILQSGIDKWNVIMNRSQKKLTQTIEGCDKS